MCGNQNFWAANLKFWARTNPISTAQKALNKLVLPWIQTLTVDNLKQNFSNSNTVIQY